MIKYVYQTSLLDSDFWVVVLSLCYGEFVGFAFWLILVGFGLVYDWVF